MMLVVTGMFLRPADLPKVEKDVRQHDTLFLGIRLRNATGRELFQRQRRRETLRRGQPREGLDDVFVAHLGEQVFGGLVESDDQYTQQAQHQDERTIGVPSIPPA